MGFFNRRWQLGRIAGFPIEVHITFVLLLAMVLLTVSWDATVGNLLRGNLFGMAMALLVGLTAALVLVASILLHELGHALVARRLGVRIGGIELQFFGGVARMVTPPRRALDEIFIAVAGPLVSFAIAAISMGLGIGLGTGLLVSVGFWNLLLGAFNLVPALPMDGGRILRAYLARKHGVIAATRRAVKVSKWVAIAMAALGLITGHLMLAGIALMVYLMSRAEAHGAWALRYTDVPGEPIDVDVLDPAGRVIYSPSEGADEQRFGRIHRIYIHRR